MEYKRTQQANRPIAEVVAGAAGGEERAWDELHRRYHRLIAGVAHTWGCSAADVPDVQQAVWARLFENIGRLRQPEAIAGWLAVVTRRECIRLCGNRPQTVQIDETAPLPSGDDEPLVTVLHAERRAAVRRAVATLPARRRTLLETMLDHRRGVRPAGDPAVDAGWQHRPDSPAQSQRPAGAPGTGRLAADHPHGVAPPERDRAAQRAPRSGVRSALPA